MPDISSGSKQPEVTALIGVSLLFPTPGKEGFLGPCGSSHMLPSHVLPIGGGCISEEFLQGKLGL